MKPFPLQKADKNPATAALLSFLFIGLGQAYNGETAKAVVFLILYALSIFLTFFMIGFVTTPILWVWSTVDAYRSSQKMNPVGTARQSRSNASLARLVMNFHVLVTLLIFLFPGTTWGKTPTFVPRETIALVFSSNVHGELEPCG